MKQCPKCNRTFPDENQKFCTVDGGLLISQPSQPAFDPNATIRATSSELGMPDPSERATSRELPNPNAYDPSSARTVVLSRDTGPTRMPTMVDTPAPPPPPPPTAQAAAPAVSAPLPTPAPAEKKKSKLPLVLGILAVLLILGVGGIAAAFFLIIKPRLDQLEQPRVAVTEPSPTTTNENANVSNTNTAVADTTPEIPPYQPPAGALKFENSSDGLEGQLADQYFDFSFYYPQGWKMDTKARAPGSSTYAKVERMLPPDFTQENFAVGWYESKGTYDADKANFPAIAEKLNEALSKSYPDYKKVSEGPTKVSSMDAYEFRFEGVSKGTERGDVRYWGRVIFLPVGDSSKTTGARLSMFTTSLAPELSSVEDVGERGELPMVLESFRFGKK
jgi:hypothetical protein